MPKADDTPTPDTQIQKDSFFVEKSLSIYNMRLTVTNIYPAFQKKSKQETRQEIGARLYQIFRKYANV